MSLVRMKRDDVMVQAVFSAELIKALNPKSVKSVILCGKDHEVLRPLLARFDNVEVVSVDRVRGLGVRHRTTPARA